MKRKRKGKEEQGKEVELGEVEVCLIQNTARRFDTKPPKSRERCGG